MKNSYRLIFFKETFIIKQLLTHNYLTIDELNDLWLDSSHSDGRDFVYRTFKRDRESIFEVFGVRITSKLVEGKYRYHIENGDVLKNNDLFKWSLAAFALGDTLLSAKTLRDRIILEEFPSENGRLQPILNAMTANRMLELDYSKYTDSKISHHTIEPYFIKEYRQRLYVIGKTETGRICPFSLDRIVSYEIIKRKFTMPESLNAEDFFSCAFGVMVDEVRWPPTSIVLRAFKDEECYMKDVPLHQSQTLLRKGEGFTDFQLFLSPTNDFIGKLISRGDRLQVLSPSSLADTVKERLLSAAMLYC